MKTILTDVPSLDRFRKGRHTIQIGYPWLTPGAIIALEEILQKDFKVIEFGCGGSTIFFADRCSYVKSFDTSKKWIGKVKNGLKENNNVEIICSTNEDLPSIVENEPSEYYDIALVDIGSSMKLRLKLARIVTSKIRTGGFLIIDNYQYRHIWRFKYDNFEVYTFDDLQWIGRGTRICKKK